MTKRDVQSTVASHRNTADSAVRTSGTDPIPRFNAGKKLLHQEILVADLPAVRIDVKRRTSLRRDNQKLTDLLPLPQVLHQVERATVHEHLLVVPEPMKKIENGIFLRLVAVIARRQNNAVVHGMRKNLAWQGLAFNSARGGS